MSRLNRLRWLAAMPGVARCHRRAHRFSSIVLAWLLVSAGPVAHAFTPGAFLVVEPGSGIRELYPYGLGGPLVISGPPLGAPSAVAFEANGNAIVADRYAGTFRYSPSGALLGSVGVAGADVAVSPNGAIYILDWVYGRVYLAPSQQVGDAIPEARGIAVTRGASGQDVVLVTSSANGGELVRVEATGPPTVLATGLGASIGQPSVDRFGNVLVPREGRIDLLDPETGASRGSFVSSTLVAPSEAGTSGGDRYFVTDADSFGTCWIREIDPIAGGLTDSNLDSACGGFAQSFAVVPGGTPAAKLVAGDIVLYDDGAFGGASGVFRIDPASGFARPLRLGGKPIAYTLSAGPTHELIAAGFTGTSPNTITGVHRIDPSTGSEKLLMSGSGVASYGSAFDRHGDVFMTEFENNFAGSILRYERATGSASTFATLDGWSGIEHDTPAGLWIPYRGAAQSGLLATFGFSAVLWDIELTPGAPILGEFHWYPHSAFENDEIALGVVGGYIVQNPNEIRRTSFIAFAQGGMLSWVVAIDVEPSGNVVAADANAFGGGGGVIRLAAANGAQTRLTPQTFVEPLGIAVVPPPSCSDGVDNDDDGQIDFGADTGCASVDDPWETVDCSDGIDNDLDGTVDYVAGAGDPSCSSALFGIESTQCSNGADDDGDGRIDASDTQCSGLADNREAPNPSGCGLLGIEGLAVLAWAARRKVGSRRRDVRRAGGR